MLVKSARTHAIRPEMSVADTAARCSAVNATSTAVTCQPRRASHSASAPSPHPTSSACPTGNPEAWTRSTVLGSPLKSLSRLRYRTSQNSASTRRSSCSWSLCVVDCSATTGVATDDEPTKIFAGSANCWGTVGARTTSSIALDHARVRRRSRDHSDRIAEADRNCDQQSRLSCRSAGHPTRAPGPQDTPRHLGLHRPAEHIDARPAGLGSTAGINHQQIHIDRRGSRYPSCRSLRNARQYLTDVPRRPHTRDPSEPGAIHHHLLADTHRVFSPTPRSQQSPPVRRYG